MRTVCMRRNRSANFMKKRFERECWLFCSVMASFLGGGVAAAGLLGNEPSQSGHRAPHCCSSRRSARVCSMAAEFGDAGADLLEQALGVVLDGLRGHQRSEEHTSE